MIQGKTTDRCHQRAGNIADHSPVEADQTKTNARLGAKERIDGGICRGNPANPVEDAECHEQIPGKPVIAECSSHEVAEETLAAHVVALGFAIIAMQGIEQCRVDLWKQ